MPKAVSKAQIKSAGKVAQLRYQILLKYIKALVVVVVALIVASCFYTTTYHYRSFPWLFNCKRRNERITMMTLLACSIHSWWWCSFGTKGKNRTGRRQWCWVAWLWVFMTPVRGAALGFDGVGGAAEDYFVVGRKDFFSLSHTVIGDVGCWNKLDYDNIRLTLEMFVIGSCVRRRRLRVKGRKQSCLVKNEVGEVDLVFF